MKLIVAGGRDFLDWPLAKKILDDFCESNSVSEIVSGKAAGADRLGEKYAEENNIPVRSFLADWDRHGRAAGPIRNEEMARYGDYLILFWDGKSRGSKNMLSQMQRLNKPYRVTNY